MGLNEFESESESDGNNAEVDDNADVDDSAGVDGKRPRIELGGLHSLFLG